MGPLTGLGDFFFYKFGGKPRFTGEGGNLEKVFLFFIFLKGPNWKSCACADSATQKEKKCQLKSREIMVGMATWHFKNIGWIKPVFLLVKEVRDIQCNPKKSYEWAKTGVTLRIVLVIFDHTIKLD